MGFLKPPAPAPFDTTDSEQPEEQQMPDQGGDVLDTIAPTQRPKIDASRGNPLTFNQTGRKWFPDEVKAAENAKRQGDALDLVEARNAQTMQRRADAQKAKEAEAATKAARTAENNRREAEFTTKRVKHYVDAEGMIQPERNEDGSARYTPHTGEIQYDTRTGKPFQEKVSERGVVTKEDPDAGAPIGTHPTDKGTLYKQNKNSPWEALGTIDEGLQSPNGDTKAAAQKAKAELEKSLHTAAKSGFEMQKNEISAKEAEAMRGASIQQQQAGAIQKQIDDLRTSPAHGATSWGFKTDAAKALDVQEKALNDQLAQINLSAPDLKQFSQAREQVAVQAGAFDYLVARHGGVEAAAEERRKQIEAAGGKPEEDPILQSVEKARAAAGLPTRDAMQKKKEQEAQQKALETHPVLGPVMQERKGIEDEAKKSAADIQQMQADAQRAADAGEIGRAQALNEQANAAITEHQTKFEARDKEWKAKATAAESLAKVADQEKRKGEQETRKAAFEKDLPDLLKMRQAKDSPADVGIPLGEASDSDYERADLIKKERDNAQAGWAAKAAKFAKDTGLTPHQVHDVLDDQEALAAMKPGQAVKLKHSGEIAVSPELAMDEKKWNAVVDATDASPEAKERAKAKRAELRDGPAGEALFEVLKASDSFQRFIDAPDIENDTAGQVVENYLKAGGEGGRKVEAIIQAAQGRFASIGQQFFGLAALLTGNKTATELMEQTTATANKADAAREALGGAGTAGFLIDTAASILPSLALSPLAKVGGAIGGRAATAIGGKIGAETVQRAASTLIMAGVGAGQSGGAVYATAYDALTNPTDGSAGLSPKDARQKAMLPAVLSALGTAVLSSIFTGGVESAGRLSRAQAREAAKSALKSYAGKAWEGVKDEAVEEFLDQINQGFIEKMTYNPGKKPEDILNEALIAGLQGGLGGGVVSGIAHQGERIATFKSDLAHYTDYADKAKEAHGVFSTGVLEKAGAFDAPSARAAEIGAKADPDLRAKIEAADTKIEELTTAAQGAEGLKAQANAAAELAQAYEARSELVSGAMKMRAFEDAAAEIDSIGENSDPQHQPRMEATRTAAKALLKISQGAPMDSLTSAEQAAVNHKDTPDGLPRVEMLKGGDGKTHAVITDGAIARLARYAPTAAKLIGKSETARRAEVLAKTKTPAAAPTQQPATTTPTAGGNIAAPVNGGNTSAPAQAGISMPAVKIGEVQPLSPAHARRSRAMSQTLQRQGVAPEVADRFTHGVLSQNGGAKVDITAAFTEAGGKLGQGADNSALAAQMKKTDADALKTAHQGLVKEHVKQAEEHFAAKGVKPSEQDKKSLTLAVVAMSPGIARWKKVFNSIHWTKKAYGSGGAVVEDGNEFTFSLTDIIAELNFEELTKSPRRAEKIVEEEAIHIIMTRVVTDQEMADLWNKLPEPLQNLVRSAYLNEGETKPDSNMGHEFMRMLIQNKLDGIISEATSPSILKSIKHILGKVLDYLTNLLSNLEKAGISEADAAAIESTANMVADQMRKISADAEQSDPYLRAYVAQTNGNRSRNGGIHGGGAALGGRKKGNSPAVTNPVTSGKGKGGIGNVNQPTGGNSQSPESVAELEKAKADLKRATEERDELIRKQETAAAKLALARANRAVKLGDTAAILAAVPPDARSAAEELLRAASMGAPTYVLGVNRESFPASYVGMAPGVVQTSHLPDQGFAQNPDGITNTRDYSTDKDEQGKVNGMARDLDAPSIVTNVKTAADGPPMIVLVINAAGKPIMQAAGGNAREMATNAAPAEAQNRLADEWQAEAGTYGLKDLPEGYRGYRFLGVFDLRDDAKAKELAALVDKLNPTSGQAASTSKRAEIDANTKFNASALAGLTLDISADQAAERLSDWIKDGSLGMEKTIMEAMVQDAPNAQLYVRRLILAAAFRSPELSEFYFSPEIKSGTATMIELLKAAAPAAIEIRKKGGDNIADGIAKTLAEVIDYAKKGQAIGSAIKQAAEQVPLGEGAKSVQAIADGLAQQIAYRSQRADGIKAMDATATAENFDQFFRDIAQAAKQHTGEADLLGDADTIEDTIQRALDLNKRRNTEYSTKPEAVVASRGPAKTDTKRLNELLRKQREEGLNRYEHMEVESLERKAGQQFASFFDDMKAQVGYFRERATAQGLSTPDEANPDQLDMWARDWRSAHPMPEANAQGSLFSRGAKKTADEDQSKPYKKEDNNGQKTDSNKNAGTTEGTGESQQDRPGEARGGMVVQRKPLRDGIGGEDSAGKVVEGRGRQRARRLDEKGRDPRLVETFGEDWTGGWNELGLPNQPKPLRKGHPLLAITKEKDFAQLSDKSKAVRLGLLPVGKHSRADLAKAITGYFLKGGDGKKEASELTELKADETPEIMLLGGGGGAGKSSMLKKLTDRGEFNPENRVLVNADEIREFIPEYDALNDLGDARSSAITHEESSDISKEIMRQARQSSFNITFDATLANGTKGLAIIKDRQAEGYRVRMVAVTIDPYEAAVRAYLRAKNSKRYVPDDVLLEAHQGFNAALPVYAEALGHEITIYDNSPEHPIAISPEEMKSGEARNITDRRAKLDKNATTLDALLASYGEDRNGDPISPLETLAKQEGGKINVSSVVIASRRAYHGTPHEIKGRFSLKKVGTGEGAQAYGWGLYFAENKAVATEYWQKLSDRLQVDGRYLDTSKTEDYASLYAYNYGGASKAADFFRSEIARTKNETTRAKFAEVLEILERGVKEARMEGAVYTVTLDVEPEDLLDWDKPLGEQSQSVKDAFAKAAKKPKNPTYKKAFAKIFPFYSGDNRTVREVYKQFAKDVGTEKDASEFLHYMGIPGIRYLDQGSRKPSVEVGEYHDGTPRFTVNGPKGDVHFDSSAEAEAYLAKWPETYNYVIFDESKIQITHKNGEEIPSVIGSRSSVVDSKDFERGSIHINIRGGEIDPSKEFTGWALPAERDPMPNAMNTRYGANGLTAVYVPNEWVLRHKTRPSRIKPGYFPKPEHIGVITKDAIRENGTVDWSKVFTDKRSVIGSRRSKADPNQIDIFANNPLTETPAKSKGTHEQSTKPTTTKPRRNKPTVGDNYSELFLDGLQANPVFTGQAPGVDSGKADAGSGGSGTAPGRPESGGNVGSERGKRGSGGGILGGTVQGGTGNVPSGVRSPLGQSGESSPAVIERPPEDSPDRNTKIDGTKNYAPKQGKARFDANMRAIKLMRVLEEEGRNATTAEKAELLAYTGWGWMKEAFNKVNAAKWENVLESFRQDHARRKQKYSDRYSNRYAYGATDPGELDAFVKSKTEDYGWDEDSTKLASWAKNYLEDYKTIRNELTEEEFDSAAKSVRNAHYTDVPVINEMWKLVRRLGFKGGRATEPGAGIGHFIGTQPDDMADKTRWNAVELDDITARILGHLYPETTVNGEAPNVGRKITGQGFQKARIPNNSQDLFISNVPFAKEGPGESRKQHGRDFNLHNYFFAQAFAKTKPGGLVVFITSNSTMDNRLDQRKALDAMGDLVGAIRMPNNAFKANAGTEVTTDIIVFRKPDGTQTGFTPANWTNTRELSRTVTTSTKPAGKKVLDWLAAQPEEWIPQDSVVAATLAAWKAARRPAGGQRVNALLEALRATGTPDTITFDAPVIANEYFAAHPEHALGVHSLEGSMYGANNYALTPKDGQNTIAELGRAIQTFPENVIGESKDAPEDDTLTAAKGDRVGAYIERDGNIYEVAPDGLKKPDWMSAGIEEGDDAAKVKRKNNALEKRIQAFRAWAGLRSAYNALIDLELSKATDEEVADGRADLNRVYDSIVRNYHPIAQRSRNTFAFLDTDPDYIPLQCLEVVTQDTDPKTGKPVFHYEKAPIFTERQVQITELPTTADTIEDAVLFSMTKNGFLHPPYVAELLGVSESEATAQLVEKKLAFINPSGGMLEVKDSYLSGNVGKKLDEAVAAAADDPKYRANVEALQAVQPPWQSITSIHPNMRAAWVPSEVIRSFAEKALGLTRVNVTHAAGTTNFEASDAGETDEKYSGGGLSAAQIMGRIMDNKQIVVKKKEQQGDKEVSVVDSGRTAAANQAREEIINAFTEYVKTSNDEIETEEGEKTTVTEAAEKAFNKNVGGWVPPTFNGDWITLPGQSGEIYLDRGFRKSVLARLLTQGYGMIAHGVGSGKTLTQVALVMEMRRLGKAKKPVIVVEKSTIGQFAASFRRAYPQAKLLVAGENNFGPKDRAKFLGMMQSGDWDAIIMSRIQVTKIPHSNEAYDNYIAEKLAELDAGLIAAEAGSKTQNSIQGIRDSLIEKMTKMREAMEENQDVAAIPWEKLGVDALLVDEAHNYKNTFVYTAMENVKNLPAAKFVQQACSMELKTSNVRDTNNGKGVFFATGTPVSNAMHEAWVMINYIAPHILKENGVETFDQFADTYGVTVTGPEATWKGEVKDTTRFAKFVHGQSLIAMIRSVFDVAMGNANLGLDVPAVKGGQTRTDILPVTPPMEAVNDWIVNVVAAQWTATFGEKDENGAVITPAMSGLRQYIEENPWVTAVPIMTMQSGIAAALDPRLLHDNAEDHPGSKVNTVVRAVLAQYNDPEFAEKKTTQVIFTDLRNSFKLDRLEEFTGSNPFQDLGPNPGQFDLYEDIARKLIAGGMKRSEIGWTEQGMTDDKKEAFFAKVNSGEIRVIIGGEGISTGVNIQERLGSAYHLMPPRNFKPAQMEQRNGRIIRQGNLFTEWGHNAFTSSVEKATGKKFEGKKPLQRRKAAEEWLADNDKDGEIRKKAAFAAEKYAVAIVELGMSRSLDSAVYAMMAAKQGFIAQILSGNAGSEFEDPTDGVQLQMAEMAAELIGDPALIRKIALERDLRKIRNDRAAWVSKRAELQGTVRGLQNEVPSAERRVAEMDAKIAKYGSIFTSRTNDKGQPIAPLYEMGDGTKFDAAAKKEKAKEGEEEAGGLLTTINQYFMKLWAERKGDPRSVSGTVKINGVPIHVEVEDILGGGDQGMPGSVMLEKGDTPWQFRGAQSFLARLRGVLEYNAKMANSEREWIPLGKRRLETSRKALAEYPATFGKEDEFNALTNELRGVREGITAATQARNEARRRAKNGEPAETETPPNAEMDRMASEGGIALGSRGASPAFIDGATPAERVTRNIAAAERIAASWDNIPGTEDDDRKATARMALTRAAQSYDPSKGAWGAYAATAIRNALRDSFGAQTRYTSRNLTTLDAPLTEGDDLTGKDNVRAPDDVTESVASKDASTLLNDLINELPAHLRDVVLGVRDGMRLEDIGKKLGGITKQGVDRRAKVGIEQLRRKLGERGITSISLMARGPVKADVSVHEQMAQLQEMAAAETPGQFEIGRPDLALGALDDLVRAVDEWRKTYTKPETHDEWQTAAEDMVKNDYEGAKQRIINAGLSGRGLSPEETKAAMMIVAKEVKRAGDNPDDTATRNDVQLLVNAYRSARAEQARGLAAGRDPFKTPAERYREFLAKVIYQAPEKVQKALDDAATPEDRRRILEKDRERIRKIEEALAKMGVTLADLFSGEVEMRLKARKIVAAELDAAKGKDADILKAFMERRNFAAVAAEMKISEAEVKRVVKEAAERVKKRHFEKFQKGATAANVDVIKSRAAGTAEDEFAKFLDVLGLTEETPAQAKKRATSKAKGRPFDINDPVAVVRIARTIQAIDSGAMSMAMEFWMNGILSGPQTHFANISGNAVSMAWDMTAQRGAEALVNKFFGKKDQAQFGEMKYLIRGILPGIERAKQLAQMAWMAEYDFTEHVLLGKPVDLQEISGKVAGRAAISGTKGRIIRMPGRALTYADSFFKGLIATMEVGAIAYRTAKAEGLTGDALEARIKEQVDTYGSPAWVQAVDKAKDLTFQKDLKQWGDPDSGGTHNPMEAMAAALQRASASCPPLRFIVPFIRTPFNIFRAGLRKTPLGSIPLAFDIGKHWIARIRNNEVEGNPELPPTFIRDFTEQSIAWTTMALIFGMCQGDPDDDDKLILITGSSAKGQATWGESDLQRRAYGGDNVIRIGGRGGFTFHYGRYEPFATVLGTMTDTIRTLKRPTEPGEKLDALFGYFMNNVQNKTFLRGISDAINATKDASGLGNKAAATLASALVPNLIRQPLRNLDDYARDSKGGGLPYAMLPISGNAEIKNDEYGKPVEKGGNSASRLLIPAPSKPAAQLEPADKLLLRWNTMNPAEKWAPQPPARTYRDQKTGKDVSMTGEEYAKFTQLAGAKARRNLAGKINSGMIARPSESDVKMIRHAFESARSEARDQMFKKPKLDLLKIMW